MNQFWKEVRLAGIMGLVVPGILLGAVVALWDDGPAEQQEMEILSTQPTQITETAQMQVSVLSEGTVTEMELSNYLTGVVLAEMPASFETEALKAQAVVARTYTIRTCQRGKKHPSGAVCTDSTCCQGYLSKAAYLDQGGKQESIDKVRTAVRETENLVLSYQGELIEATYFSCSGGSTEDAVAVWGTDVPYLQAVASPGEENAAHYSDTVTFKAEEFASLLGLDLTGAPKSWIGPVSYTEGGGVDTMEIGGVRFKGTTLRSALGLRSTAFSVSCTNDAVTITTRGFGHRVGMSQYGADAMAVNGSTFEEILSYYYQGTELTQWID